VYKALEEVAGQISDDPIAGQIIFPELTRLPAIEADLAFYYGTDWAKQVDVLGVTDDYTDRIRKIAANDPIRYVAHHYTRYLADLSGGFMIDRGITKAYGLELDGRRYYIFDAIPNAKEFKENYRDVLNGMDIDLETKRTLVEETLVAYEFNVEMIRLLSERHDPIEIDGGTVVDGEAAPHPHA
jgi:heme oxygenase